MFWLQGGADMDAHNFGAFVAECRKEKKMTQAELAAKLENTYFTIRDVLTAGGYVK